MNEFRIVLPADPEEDFLDIRKIERGEWKLSVGKRLTSPLLSRNHCSFVLAIKKCVATLYIAWIAENGDRLGIVISRRETFPNPDFYFGRVLLDIVKDTCERSKVSMPHPMCLFSGLTAGDYDLWEYLRQSSGIEVEFHSHAVASVRRLTAAGLLEFKPLRWTNLFEAVAEIECHQVPWSAK